MVIVQSDEDGVLAEHRPRPIPPWRISRSRPWGARLPGASTAYGNCPASLAGTLVPKGEGPSGSAKAPRQLNVYAVDLDRRVMEHRRTFGRRVGPGEPFERVVQHVIGKGDFVRWKVAFEHAPLRTELLNTVLQP